MITLWFIININKCYGTVTCNRILNWPQSKVGQHCVLMVYCGLNNNTFKLFIKDHMFIDFKLTISFVSHYKSVFVDYLSD